jgi:putative hydrolase of the HAD superfamily
VYNAVDASFRKVWHEQHLTWTVRERLKLVLEGLGFSLPVSEMEELIRLHEEMELEFRPDIISGVHEAIDQLHGKYILGIISDAIFSPGRVLRKLLEDEGLLAYFDAFIFSDEIGQSKPHPLVFSAACDTLGIKTHELVHIGDREHNDIIGPKKLGIQSVLCAAAIDRGSERTQATAKFKEYSELHKIIDCMK